ncbi:MAG: adenylate/guanylate cyclase domain-containing protein [Anaerolineae bacterium]
MPALPSGIITVLFTDIQASTRLWQTHPDAMPDALARHHALLRAAIEAHRGYVFQIVGDAFCAAFASASDGVLAALAAQRALRDEPWGETGPLYVRMALETGPVELHAGEYVSGEYASGLTLSRVARLLASGHGGQVLLSAAAAEMVRDHLPAQVTLRDLGSHRLKDLEHPLRIFQLVALDLPVSFPPLRTIDHPVHPLPAPLTRFIGRTRELDEITRLVAAARLVTLTGPGGAGKTRLSIEVARAMTDEFQDGVVWLTLAEINDPAFVGSAICHALDLAEIGGYNPGDLLEEYVRERQMLLALDNFEQVTSAAPLLARLLAAAPGLRLLVTSREVLHLAGEQQYPVPPLGSGGAEFPPEKLLAENSAVQLFVERARAVRPAFALTAENQQAIVEITARLDGLPLAIELAAARVKLLTPAALLKQLKASGLGLLTSTARDLPARQQTLRGAIAWSYDALAPVEQELFCRLGVFVGSVTLDAIAAVCAGDDLPAAELLDLLTALVDKSLVHQREEGDEAQFVMLETIRAYAHEKLRERGQEDLLRNRHLDYYLALGQEAADGMSGPRQGEWFDRLEHESGNMREALEWCRADAARAPAGLTLAAALGFFWSARNHLSEGQVWLDEMLRLNPLPSAARGLALVAYAFIAYYQGDTDRGLALVGEGAEMCRALNDPAGIGRFMAWQGVFEIFRSHFAEARRLLAQSVSLLRQAGDQKQLAQALSYYGLLGIFAGASPEEVAHVEEAVALYRRFGDPMALAETLLRLGTILLQQEDLPRARRLIQEGLACVRSVGAVGLEMEGRGHLAEVALMQGDLDQAQGEARQALEAFRILGVRASVPWALDLLGLAALERGDAVDATAYFRESLDGYRRMGDARALAESLAGLAGVALLQEDPVRGIRLMAAAQAILDRVQGQLGPADAAAYDRRLAQARRQANPEAFEQAWAEGYALEMEPATAYALRPGG